MAKRKGAIPEVAAYGEALGGAAEQTGEAAGRDVRAGVEDVLSKIPKAQSIPGEKAVTDWAKSVPGALGTVGGQIGSLLLGDQAQPTAQLGPATEAYLKEQKAKQKAADQAPGEVPPEKALSFPAEAQKLIGTAQQPLTLQQDIDKMLAPYMNALNALGPEYGAEMAYLQPYMAGGQTGGINAPAYTGPNAAGVNQAQAALGQAEQATAGAYQNMNTPGFGNAAQLAGQYENALQYGQPIQAALGYQKYLETYGGQSPGTAGVPQNIQDVYKYIGGGAGSTSGLPNPANAAAGANANALLNTAQNQGTGVTK